jgi:hypothetical protein
MAVDGLRGYSLGSVAQPANMNPVKRKSKQALNTPGIRQEWFANASLF